MASNLAIKLLALSLLVFQNASVALVMRYSFVSRSEDEQAYMPSVAVFTQEAIKFLLSICLVFVEKRYRFIAATQTLAQSLNLWDMLNVSVPAFLYVVQNNLLYVASANMSPAPLQLLFQLKIFTTAVLSVAILGKRLSGKHWGSLLALFIGICIVQYSVQDEAKSQSYNTAAQNPLLGLGAILVAVTCSGLAGVWFEKILKKKEVSLWTSNFQLSLISMAISIVTIWGQTATNNSPHDWYVGFTPIVWTVVLLQSLGGLLIAVVVKYTDNIIKGYATSIATVLGTVGSVVWFNFIVSPVFLLGSAVVLVSAYVYGTAENLPASTPTAKSETNEEEAEKFVAMTQQVEEDNKV